jgi:alpha-D-ribose 1-methylphosphonate 5-triphosphate diphosphatase
VAGAIDCGGDYLAPGLVELHTDNLERHLSPRPGVDWPHRSAILAHDAELAGTGITTVFDALRVGSIVSDERSRYGRYARPMADEILGMRAEGALRISHFLHLRAEVCSETLEAEMDEFGPADSVGIVSLMDHTPGQRQFTDLTQLKRYLRGKYSMTEAEIAAHIGFQQTLGARVRDAHEGAAVAAARRYGATLASHDDTTAEHVARSAAHGVGLAEFPTTRAAAEACRAHGIAVMMGAPNLIRGGSHSGNVAAEELARAGLLDAFSSDYVPAALLQAAVRLAPVAGGMAAAIATVTAAPAAAAGLADRGRLAPGLRADLLRFALIGGAPRVVETWVQGRRVA